jgi:hypothetical protein
VGHFVACCYKQSTAAVSASSEGVVSLLLVFISRHLERISVNCGLLQYFGCLIAVPIEVLWNLKDKQFVILKSFSELYLRGEERTYHPVRIFLLIELLSQRSWLEFNHETTVCDSWKSLYWNRYLLLIASLFFFSQRSTFFRIQTCNWLQQRHVRSTFILTSLITTALWQCCCDVFRFSSVSAFTCIVLIFACKSWSALHACDSICDCK